MTPLSCLEAFVASLAAVLGAHRRFRWLISFCVQIFTAGLRSTPLDHNKVLDFLGKQPSGNQLLEQYLEHVVLQEGHPSERYSTMLANMYLDTVLTLFPPDTSTSPRAGAGRCRSIDGVVV